MERADVPYLLLGAAAGAERRSRRILAAGRRDAERAGRRLLRDLGDQLIRSWVTDEMVTRLLASGAFDRTAGVVINHPATERRSEWGVRFAASEDSYWHCCRSGLAFSRCSSILSVVVSTIALPEQSSSGPTQLYPSPRAPRSSRLTTSTPDAAYRSAERLGIRAP